MKRCPICSQVFGDENIYCLNDGTALETFQIQPSPFDTPTGVFPSVQTKTALPKAENKSFYWIFGAMSGVIIMLALIIYALISKSDTTSLPNKEQSENSKKNKNSDISNVLQHGAQNTPENKEIIQKESLPVTSEAARDLIERWEKSQDARNFNAYKSCYAPQFFGIKRTKSGSESRLDYAQWLNDRQKMLKNTIDVSVQNLEIIVEGDTATARFIQQFQSANYQDEGQKILKIKMFADGAKIVYEELKYSY